MKRRTFLQRASIFAATASFATFLPRRARATSTIVSINSLNNVEMFNSTWGRPVALPSNWNEIRAGVLFHFQNAAGASNLTSSPIFALGFCNNTTNMYGDANTTHFVGLYTNSATWASNGGSCPTPGSGWFSITLSPTVIVNGSQTTGTALASSTAEMPACDTIRGVLFIDLIKGSPNYTFKTFFVSGSTVDVSTTTFLAQMGLVTPSLANHTYSAGQTMAVNEATNGALNTVNCYWNRADVSCHLSAVAVAVLS